MATGGPTLTIAVKVGFQRKLREALLQEVECDEAKECLDSSVAASTSVGDASKCRHFLQRSRSQHSNFSCILTISAQINFGRSFARWLGTVDAGAAAGDDQSCGSYAAHLNQSELGEHNDEDRLDYWCNGGVWRGDGAAVSRRPRWRVVATGRRAERLRTLVDEFGSETVAAAPFDMRDLAAMNATLSALPEPFRGIDVLVNNAGLALGTAPAPEARLDDWLRMIETNVTGLVTLTHRLLPILIERKGLIVNLSSVAGTYPYPGGNVYGATKAFVRQFSLGLRSDLHSTGVRVTSIEPGLAKTEFTLVRTGGDQAASDALYRGVVPADGRGHRRRGVLDRDPAAACQY